MSSKVVDDALRQASISLLDMSLRNRLISTPRGRARSTSIEILDELSTQVYERLAVEGKAMSFLALDAGADGEMEEAGDLEQPDDELIGDASRRHADDKLQTRLASKTLQGRLLKQFYDARTFEEEQGVSIHFLALGFLKWYESDASSQDRYAPLLLVPVRLERTNVGSKFKLLAGEEDLATNLSLQYLLHEKFGLRFPSVGEQDTVDPEEFSPAEYFQRVRAAIRGQKRWEVLENEVVLWFFSFAKFLMFRDLDPKTWPQEHPLPEQANVKSVFDGGFRTDRPVLDDDAKLDPILDPADIFHVVDADGSQSVAIEEVRRGSHLVVQGPPGTGKSQTITNIISAAVKAGKKVLFVAEKLAALNVVKSRLDNIGLGAMCLELHSHKANKKAVLEEIKQTLALARPRVANLQQQIDELRKYRDELNDYASALHEPLLPAGICAYEAMGELIRVAAQGLPVRRFALEQPLAWSQAQFKAKAALVEAAAQCLARVGDPQAHPWRGAGCDVLLPTDVQDVVAKTHGAAERLERLIQASDALAGLLQVACPASLREVSALAVLANQLGKAPPVDEAIAHPLWATQLGELEALVQAGNRHHELREGLAGKVESQAWKSAVGPARKQIALRGNSWFRWLNKGYRQASAQLEEICIERPPRAVEERLALLDQLIAGQKAAAAIEAGNALGRSCFGSAWRGVESDFAQLAAIIAWVKAAAAAGAAANFREVLTRLQDKEACAKLLSAIAKELKPAVAELQAIVQTLMLDVKQAFGQSELANASLADLRSRLAAWLQNSNAVHDWTAYRIRLERLAPEGLKEFAQLLDGGSIQAQDAGDYFARVYYESVLRECYRQHPLLAAFTGPSHEAAREQFRKLDKLRIELARKEVALAHYQAMPRESSLGEMSKLNNELQKKARHWPMRKLLREAGRAVQAIKPVFMMSPTSIAQFLQPGVLDFDLLLIDEASQVRPVEALGAMARSQQIVVVGDDKQMPPSNFFAANLDGAGASEEDDSLAATDPESILGLCLARNIRSKMLSWHYRSRHHSLIAVSNYEFYGNQLYVIPNPETRMEGYGLRFHYLAGGRFDRGGTATNAIEAQSIAAAVMEHARAQPDQSLGVGTFSMAQRDAILAELEQLRRSDPSLEAFFMSGVEEPFFVKNLENLQGDERDVIFISVGYGPDKNGYCSMSFGPLNQDGGERRLNVLISRARDRCEVFSSLRADDIDLARTPSRGAAALKRFLQYAETGLLDAETQTSGEHDSPFEEQVARALRGHGYEIAAQVGVAGFFVDLAVKDPAKPGRYLLGIECDGATYHSARWARDRDRLRQQVLESRGWTIHRIWSTDWFRKPDDQLRRLLSAIESAKAIPPFAPQVAQCVKDISPTPAGEETAAESAELAEVHNDIRCYQQAEPNGLMIDGSRGIHEIPTSALAEIAAGIVRVEGPIHREEVARRIGEFWGFSRTTKKMISAVDAALDYAASRQELALDGDFCAASGSEVIVRNRESAAAALRLPDRLPPREVAQAILHVVARHVGLTEEEAIVASGRLLGFKATGPQLKRVIARELDRLMAENKLAARNDRLAVVEMNEE